MWGRKREWVGLGVWSCVGCVWSCAVWCALCRRSTAWHVCMCAGVVGGAQLCDLKSDIHPCHTLEHAQHARVYRLLKAGAGGGVTTTSASEGTQYGTRYVLCPCTGLQCMDVTQGCTYGHSPTH